MLLSILACAIMLFSVQKRKKRNLVTFYAVLRGKFTICITNASQKAARKAYKYKVKWLSKRLKKKRKTKKEKPKLLEENHFRRDKPQNTK